MSEEDDLVMEVEAVFKPVDIDFVCFSSELEDQFAAALEETLGQPPQRILGERDW